MSIKLLVFLTLATCVAAGGMVIGAMLLAEKRYIAQSTELKRRAEARALKVDAMMVESLFQTRVFLWELASDPSQPEDIRDRAGRLYHNYPGRVPDAADSH